MVHKNLKRICRTALLIGAVIPTILLGKNAKASEIERVKSEPAIGRTLEERVSKPKIDINFSYKYEDAQKSIDYYVSNSRFFQDYGILWRNSNIPELTYSEKNQVENIMKDVKYDNIKSYQELVRISESLSENQKLVLLSAIGGILRDFNYCYK